MQFESAIRTILTNLKSTFVNLNDETVFLAMEHCFVLSHSKDGKQIIVNGPFLPQHDREVLRHEMRFLAKLEGKSDAYRQSSIAHGVNKLSTELATAKVALEKKPTSKAKTTYANTLSRLLFLSGKLAPVTADETPSKAQKMASSLLTLTRSLAAPASTPITDPAPRPILVLQGSGVADDLYDLSSDTFSELHLMIAHEYDHSESSSDISWETSTSPWVSDADASRLDNSNSVFGSHTSLSGSTPNLSDTTSVSSRHSVESEDSVRTLSSGYSLSSTSSNPTMASCSKRVTAILTIIAAVCPNVDIVAFQNNLSPDNWKESATDLMGRLPDTHPHVQPLKVLCELDLDTLPLDTLKTMHKAALDTNTQLTAPVHNESYQSELLTKFAKSPPKGHYREAVLQKLHDEAKSLLHKPFSSLTPTEKKVVQTAMSNRPMAIHRSSHALLMTIHSAKMKIAELADTPRRLSLEDTSQLVRHMASTSPCSKFFTPTERTAVESKKFKKPPMTPLGRAIHLAAPSSITDMRGRSFAASYLETLALRIAHDLKTTHKPVTREAVLAGMATQLNRDSKSDFGGYIANHKGDQSVHGFCPAL